MGAPETDLAPLRGPRCAHRPRARRSRPSPLGRTQPQLAHLRGFCVSRAACAGRERHVARGCRPWTARGERRRRRRHPGRWASPGPPRARRREPAPSLFVRVSPAAGVAFARCAARAKHRAGARVWPLARPDVAAAAAISGPRVLPTAPHPVLFAPLAQVIALPQHRDSIAAARRAGWPRRPS